MKNLFFLAIFMIAIIAGCKKEEDTIPPPSPPPSPIANFTYDVTDDFAPTDVMFINASINATKYYWNFGDGSSGSVDKNPTHNYSSGGVYTVNLTASGESETARISKTINIGNPPSKLQINSLKLKSYPQTNSSGNNWDYINGPDIYWTIENKDMTTTYFIGSKYSDVVTSNLPLTYTNGLPLTVSNLNATYIIAFYDEDSPDTDDYMGAYYFKPFEWTTYPSTLNFYSSTSDWEFDLSVLWTNNKSVNINDNSQVKRIELIPINR